MLQQICEHLNNYFIEAHYAGQYSIAGGVISPLSLKDGQRFLVAGSSLNDGVYTYLDGRILNDDGTEIAGLADETFAGTVCAMAVPPSVIALSAEIAEWVGKYGDVIDGPYSSESFGGYSYTKATDVSGKDRNAWQSAFAGRLKRWRKIAP